MKEDDAEEVVAFGEHVGRDDHVFVDRPFDREPPAIDLGFDCFNDDA